MLIFDMHRRKVKKKRWSFFVFSILTIIVIGGIYGTLAVTEETSVMVEEDCRNCHNGTVDRHHLLIENEGYNCTDCHTMKWDDETQSYYSEVIRDCLFCHIDVNHTNSHHLLVENEGYDCTYCHTMRWDDETQSYYPEVIWDCPICHTGVNPNAPTGVHGLISCSTCHVEKPKEEICYQCHNDPANSYHGVDIYAQFTASTDNYSGMGIKKQFYDTVNTRHDVSDEDQAYSSASIECTNCHSAHLASRENILIDPDDGGTPFNQTVVHPGSQGSYAPEPQKIEVDSITFCLKCHDNTWATDGTVVGPDIIKDIAASYLDHSAKGDEHGAASGSNNSVLRGPYASWGTSSGIPPMPCTDCHDPHGSSSIYHLRTLTDQCGVPITITSENIDDNIVANWCSHCHNNPMNQLDRNKKNCISSRCHAHDTKGF
jgi:hypothetical protein